MAEVNKPEKVSPFAPAPKKATKEPAKLGIVVPLPKTKVDLKTAEKINENYTFKTAQPDSKQKKIINLFKKTIG
ncbi:MAG: hypothetical protein WC371_04100 [Parachlamydiales bacterium]|jgi:hypothetical protein